MQNFVKKLTSLTLIFTVLSITLAPSFASAASISSAKATFGRLKASTASDSVVVQFASPTGIQTGGADTVSLTFSADFTVAAFSAANFDIGLGDSSNCSTANYTDEIVAASPSATDWGVGVAGNVITFSPETDDTLTAGFCMRFEIGTAATTGGTGSASAITNGAADDDDTIDIGGVFGDTGTITVDIIDDDQVTVTANVNQSITFDIDTATTDTESATPYTVALGTITASDTRVSGATDSVNFIWLDLGTNASGGATVTVKNVNGANGLVSTSTPADNINSADGAMADGTENYGLCVVSVAQTTGTLSKATPYNSGTCAGNSETNDVQALTTTGESIITSTAPLGAGRASIAVNGAISTSTPAHADYTDTLTFIATATF